MTTMRVIGPGRAGRSFAEALSQRGWTCVEMLGRGDRLSEAAADVDLLVIATPDDAIASVAAEVAPVADTLVIHLSGSRTLEVLALHPRRGSIHPLASLPDPQTGAERLVDGCPLAVAGDPGAFAVADVIGGPVFEVSDDVRPMYHAAACVAANHLVALCGQVERLGSSCGVPAEMFMGLMQGALDSVRDSGARHALTGPASRGDSATIEAHLDELPAGERDLYGLLAEAAAELAGVRLEVSWNHDA